MPRWSCLQLFGTIYMGEQAQMTSVMTSFYRLILDVNQAFDGVSTEACNLFRCYTLWLIGFLLCPKQDDYGHIVRHLKWVKTTNFQILCNATSLGVTNQHSSKWYPRLGNPLVGQRQHCVYVFLMHLSVILHRNACFLVLAAECPTTEWPKTVTWSNHVACQASLCVVFDWYGKTKSKILCFF